MEAYQGAVILMMATTGHGKEQCGHIIHNIQAELPDEYFDPDFIVAFCNNTNPDGFEGALKNGFYGMERTGVMCFPFHRGDPLERDHAGQRWGDDDRNLSL